MRRPRVEEGVGGLLLVVIWVSILASAAQRYVPGLALLWPGELARYSLVWLTFITAGALAVDDEHLTLKLFDNMSSWTLRSGLRILGIIVVILCGAVLVWVGLPMAQRMMRIDSIAMGVPMGFIYGAPAFGGALIVLRLTAFFVKRDRAVDSKADKATVGEELA